MTKKTPKEPNDSDEIVLRPIGVVHSCFKDRFGTPRQPGLVSAAEAEIEIHPEYQPEFSLNGLDEYSHLWVIFHFHKNTNKKFNAKVHPPRLAGKTVGVFASRSPHRPNPLGLSVVQIVRVEKNKVIVRGQDLVDGTPVLDLKPYIRNVESIPDAVSGWTDHTEKKSIDVTWKKEVLENLFAKFPDANHIQILIEQTLGLDPRPLVYKGFEGQSSDYRDVHAVRLADVDVHFMFHSPRHVEVIEVRPLFS